MRLVGEKLGIPVEFATDPSWQALMEKFHKDEIDVLPALAKTPEREKTMLFTKPYLGVRFVYESIEEESGGDPRGQIEEITPGDLSGAPEVLLNKHLILCKLYRKISSLPPKSERYGLTRNESPFNSKPHFQFTMKLLISKGIFHFFSPRPYSIIFFMVFLF